MIIEEPLYKKMPPELKDMFTKLPNHGSEEVEKVFPESDGQQGDVKGTEPSHTGQSGIYGNYGRSPAHPKRNDNGSASRFFYCAKSSKAERNYGLNEFNKKYPAPAEFRPNHLKKAKDGDDGLPYGRWSPRANNHPTVKPLSLMRYLVRLVTPPNGICVDPFVGSGTTGMACKLEEVDFIGMDKEKEYCDIARGRIEAISQIEIDKGELILPEEEIEGQIDMF